MPAREAFHVDVAEVKVVAVDEVLDGLDEPSLWTLPIAPGRRPQSSLKISLSQTSPWSCLVQEQLFFFLIFLERTSLPCFLVYALGEALEILAEGQIGVSALASHLGVYKNSDQKSWSQAKFIRLLFLTDRAIFPGHFAVRAQLSIRNRKKKE